MAKRIYNARRRRASAFADHAIIFHEPPWDMLLDLYIAEREQRMVSVTSACLAADVPITTGLRWIATLEQRGMVKRIEDAGDGRRTHVRLTEQALATMEQYLRSV